MPQSLTEAVIQPPGRDQVRKGWGGSFFSPLLERLLGKGCCISILRHSLGVKIGLADGCPNHTASRAKLCLWGISPGKEQPSPPTNLAFLLHRSGIVKGPDLMLDHSVHPKSHPLAPEATHPAGSNWKGQTQ